MNLAVYQEKAVEKLQNAFRELLRTTHARTQIVFKAPTGSGKTIMTAALLKRLVETDLPEKYVYIWAAPNALHEQSRKKLESYLTDSRYAFLSIEEITAEPFAENTLLFTNWEKVFKQDREGNWANVLVRENETGRNIQDIMRRVREDGLQTILIVDEAHQTFLGPNSKRFVDEIIQPKLVLEVSATPLLNPSATDVEMNRARTVTVPFDDVRESGMIKEEVRINFEIGDYVSSDLTQIEAVMLAALEKRTDLAKAYKKERTEVKPLMLVQLPSEASALSEVDKTTRLKIEEILAGQSITYENGKLAIWLSEDKRNLEGIEAIDSGVEVLIFKRAIALGWDCPRAGVLAMLTDVQSETFKIQTVGRIMRMPEQKHYVTNELNKGYVYTNVSGLSIEIDDSDGPNYIKLREVRLKEEIQNVLLPSVFLHRTDYHDLTLAFRNILTDRLDTFFGVREGADEKEIHAKIDEKLEISKEELTEPIIIDMAIENLDAIDQDTVKTIAAAVDHEFIERRFRYLLKAWCAPYNFARSESVLKTALYKWFRKGGFEIDQVQRFLVCSAMNQTLFNGVIVQAKSTFESKRHEEIEVKREVTAFVFCVPEVELIGKNYALTSAARYAQKPYFAKTNERGERWETEVTFETFLDANEKVQWWYKNGEKTEDYFAVKYFNAEYNRHDAFYPDYIVRLADGRIGIFDTKSGMTARNEATKHKADALQNYITEHKKLNLFGGIVKVQDDAFLLQNGEYDNNDSEKWIVLSL